MSPYVIQRHSLTALSQNTSLTLFCWSSLPLCKWCTLHSWLNLRQQFLTGKHTGRVLNTSVPMRITVSHGQLHWNSAPPLNTSRYDYCKHQVMLSSWWPIFLSAHWPNGCMRHHSFSVLSPLSMADGLSCRSRKRTGGLRNTDQGLVPLVTWLVIPDFRQEWLHKLDSQWPVLISFLKYC